jgi:anti-sigma factor ChrR (cupin superfamily)
MLDLDQVTWRSTRYAGVSIHFLASDRPTGYAAVLVRMQPGSRYPAHRHHGAEEVFVLEGSFEDDRGRHGQGDFVVYEDGSAHHPSCPAGGPACTFFAIAREGIELFPDDPGRPELGSQTGPVC